MIIKGIIEEDFVNYKKPCMTIMMPNCDFKCDRECGERVCQNSGLAGAPPIPILARDIIDKYLANDISQALCFQGLEPFDSWSDLFLLVCMFRKKTDDDIVIYTGYKEDEISDKILMLKTLPNIIIKFGRFIPNQRPHFDDILGVELASNNQYAKKIS